MSYQTIVQGENSPELIAYKLFMHIVHAEDKSLGTAPGKKSTVDRKFILDTYQECLFAVRGTRYVPG